MVTSPKNNNEHPDLLKPYAWYGLDLGRYSEKDKNITIECPWCGKKKFAIKQATGQWQCLSCQEGSRKGGGNIYTFLSILHKLSLESTTDSEYDKLAEDRDIRYGSSLKTWGACKSLITGEWLLPAYNGEGKLCNLQRYMEYKGKYTVLQTPTLGVHLYGRHLFDPTKPILNVCEGFWDGVALWETLEHIKRRPDGELLPTLSSSESLLQSHNVLALPGSKIYYESWNPLFKGMATNIIFDNDYPKETKTGSIVQAGFQGTKKIASILFQIEDGPAEVNYLKWGEDGYTTEYPNKFDTRDLLTSPAIDPKVFRELRLRKFKKLVEMLHPAPLEWADEAFEAQREEPVVPIIYCDKYETVLDAWKEYHGEIDVNVDATITFMFSVVASTLAVGDQLWGLVYAPASSGKSEFCEGLSLNKEYIVAKSSIKGFYSGFGTGEMALISEASGMTLVIKEANVLLESGNLQQIMSEGRDVYDGHGRPSYRNKASKDYNAIRMTWLIAGTKAMRIIDKTELGTRFLSCVMMKNISPEREMKNSVRASKQAFKEARQSSENTTGSIDNPKLQAAKQLTGGYVQYLRKNASEMLAKIESDDSVYEKCAAFGMFTSYIRARPGDASEYEDEKEMAYRLTKQYSRIAACATFVRNKIKVDDEILGFVRKYCLDTSDGSVLRLVKKLYMSKGLSATRCYHYLGASGVEGERILEFLKNIGTLVEEPRKLKSGELSKTQSTWKVSPFVQKLYRTVVLGR
jgi:ribosomal protein L37AE/L43A